MKDLLLTPFRALWKIYFFIIFSGTLLLLYPVFLWNLQKPERFVTCFRWMRFWAVLLQIFGGVVLLRKYSSPLPKPPYIICANHSSYWDIILMYRVFRDYFVFMGKDELRNWPVFHVFFTKGMNILVNRKNPVGATKALQEAGERLDRGECVVIFPEGTIPKTAPKMKAFKNGAFRLAVEKQVPIVPVTFTGNWKLLQGSVFLKGKAGPGITKAIVHSPVSTKGLSEEDIVPLKNKVYQIIASGLEKS
ncbi:MAG: 1-acyl-sn-glycerol-3-phosphate acyltransferase [Bacteroidetes bacterium]|nr:MAG: 1-acyl-sn-glycerol-3-phosphate acyltransferase [Bacteroidota bacterium]